MNFDLCPISVFFFPVKIEIVPVKKNENVAREKKMPVKKSEKP